MAKSTSRMTIDERYAYLQIQYERYCRATKPEKNRLLDEMMAVTGLTRNHLIELLQHPPKRQARQQQRHNSYAAATDAALQVIWEAQNYIGAERLQAVLWPTAQALERAGELTLTPQVRSDLQQLSVSTLYRHLRQQATPANRRRASIPYSGRFPPARFPGTLLNRAISNWIRCCIVAPRRRVSMC